MKQFKVFSVALVAAFFLLSCYSVAQPPSSSLPLLLSKFATQTDAELSTTSVSTANQIAVQVKENRFRQNLLHAAASSQKKGDISRLDLVRLRVATLSPAFLKKAEDLSVIQMAASGEDGPFSVDENGEIVRETVDWDNLITFLEKLIPLILLLIKAFGA